MFGCIYLLCIFAESTINLMMKAKTKTSVTDTLRSMSVGDSITFPVDVKENTARAMAVRLKAEGLEFRVSNKNGLRAERIK